MTNHSVGMVLGLVSMVFLLVGYVTCIYGVNSSSYSPKIRQLAILGTILTFFIVFAIVATRYAVLALAIIPSPIIFLLVIFRPSIVKQIFIRAYLTLCLTAGVAISLVDIVWLLRA